MLTAVIATILSSSQVFASIGEWSGPMFDNFLPFAYLAIGCVIGAILLLFVISAVQTAFDWLMEHFTGKHYNISKNKYE